MAAKRGIFVVAGYGNGSGESCVHGEAIESTLMSYLEGTGSASAYVV